MKTLSFPPDLNEIKAPMTTFIGYGGIAVTTNRVSFGVVPVDSVLDGSVTPIEVVATQDGGGFISEWDTADNFDDVVYVEKYTAEGRVFHGWINRKTRKIVQTG